MQSFVELVNERRSVASALPHPEYKFAYRLELPLDRSHNHTDIFVPSNDLVITVRNFSVNQTFHDDHPGLGRLIFLVHLGGSETIELENVGRHEIEQPKLAIYYQPEGVTKRTIWNRGSNQLSVGIGVWAAEPPEILREHLSVLPEWAGEESLDRKSLWYESPLPFEVAQAAQHIVSPRMHPRLLRSYLATKANELLCLGLDAVLTRDDASAYEIQLQRKLSYAKTLLESALQLPPSLSELSAVVGLPASELSKALREEDGLTLCQYVVDRRMTRAKQLLTETRTPLKRISYDLGYRHTSNFCIAFKRRYGMTPGEAREAASMQPTRQ